MSDVYVQQHSPAASPIRSAAEWRLGTPELRRVIARPGAARPAAGRPCARTPAAPADGSAFNDLMMAVAARRDRLAFAALFDHFAPRVKAFALRRGCDAATAEELAQEVMLTVWRRAASFDSRYAGVGTWIFVIARNRCIDWSRRERRPAESSGDPDLIAPVSVSADDRVATAEREERVRWTVEGLPPEQAELVHLAYFEGKTHWQIAEEKHLPLGTVKARLRRALSRLRRTLTRTA